MHSRTPLILAWIGILLTAPSLYPAAASWYQDDLIKASDAIAVIDIHERKFPNINGSLLQKNGEEYPTALILYTSSVVTPLFGRLPREPFIVQFDGAGDRSPLKPGRHILFLKSQGYLYMPLETIFSVKDDKAFWYRKPFLKGSYGPDYGEVPLGNAIRDIKQLIRKYRS